MINLKKISEEGLQQELSLLSEKLSSLDNLIPPAEDISPAEIIKKLPAQRKLKLNRQEFFYRTASLAAACLALIFGIYYINFRFRDNIPTNEGVNTPSVLEESEFTSEQPQPTESLKPSVESEQKSENSREPSFESNLGSENSREPNLSESPDTSSKNPPQTLPETNTITATSYKDISNALKSIAGRSKEKMGYSDYTDGGSWLADGSPKPNLPGNTDHGVTNVQVGGVDEGDILKNDGKYIYWLYNDRLNIIDAKNAGSMKLVSSISLKNNPNHYNKEIYIFKNKLIVIATDEGSLASYNNNATAEFTNDYYSLSRSVTVTIFDTTDKNNPKKERTFKQDGYYVSSRLIGSHLYIASVANINPKLIDDERPELFVPNISDSSATGKFTPIAAKDIAIIPDSSVLTYAVITGLDISDPKGEVNTKACLGSGHYVYGGTDNIYIASEDYEFTKGVFSIKTNIIKFGISGGKVTSKATGTVPGTIIGQFAMDEFDSHFRVATTTYSSLTSNYLNNIYVLDKDLKLTGSIEGLAPGELIYSVRFMGERAYMITYMTTDPLFVIDLKDHTKPKVLGELEMPGFSSYLHPYSQNLLIGLGKDTEEIVNSNGTKTALSKGLKISLYDVSDPVNPTEVTKLILGNRSSNSIALDDHKAFFFSKEKNIIAFPANLANENNIFYFSGSIVLSLDPEKGFTVKAELPNHDNSMNFSTRVTYIGNTCYMLYKDRITAYSMDNFSQISYLDLTSPK